MLKIAAFAPTPTARLSTATTVEMPPCLTVRRAYRMSDENPRIVCQLSSIPTSEEAARISHRKSPRAEKHPPWRWRRSSGIRFDSQSVVHGDPELLLGSEVALGRLDGDVSEQELD